MGADQFTGKLQIYGPIGTKTYLKHVFKSFAAKHIVDHEIHEIRSGRVCEEDTFYVEARPLKHSVLCLGYRFVQKDTRKILISKAAKYGLEGPILKEIQLGKTVSIKGKKISPNQVSKVVEGIKIVYIMDTGICKNIDILAKNATILVIEGTVLDELKVHAKKSGHLTVKQAAQIAKKNKVKKLIVTHFSQRYKNDLLLRKEAKKYFKGAIIAKDLMQVDL
jgi:ribonuclease Z